MEGAKKRQLGGAAELFSNYATKGFLQGFTRALYVLAEDFIDEGLVVAAASTLDLVAEPRKDLFIYPDGDAGFPSAD